MDVLEMVVLYVSLSFAHAVSMECENSEIVKTTDHELSCTSKDSNVPFIKCTQETGRECAGFALITTADMKRMFEVCWIDYKPSSKIVTVVSIIP